VPLVYAGDTTAGYLRRREGDALLQGPFGPLTPFPDGLGEREVLRADTSHRLEVPVWLGAAGMTATPFVGGRATAWSENADEEDTPTRLVAEAGLRVATTFWTELASGAVHQISPFVEVRGDLAHEEQGGEPVAFDRTEDSVEGLFVELGLRARFGAQGGRSLLDVDLRSVHASDVPTGEEGGWQPVQVFARLDVEPLGAPVELWHDGRYDLEDGSAPYSLSSLAVRFTDDLRTELAYRRGLALDDPDDTLFEAASVAAIYRWTEKWEFEGRETLSLIDDQSLDNRFVLRRYGHDVVFEIEYSFRAGEGGSTVGVNLRPRLGFHPPRIGYVDY
jgi:hypothetical protein